MAWLIKNLLSDQSIDSVFKSVVLCGHRVKVEAVERVLGGPAVHRKPGVVPGSGSLCFRWRCGGSCRCGGGGRGGGGGSSGRPKTSSQPHQSQPSQTHDPQPPEPLRLLSAGVALGGGRVVGHRAGCGRSHHVGSVDESNGPLAVERHDLLDAVPVGLGQGEAARGGSRVVAHHAQSGLRGVAVGFGGHPVLPGI